MLTLLQTLQLEFGTAILYLSVDATSVQLMAHEAAFMRKVRTLEPCPKPYPALGETLSPTLSLTLSLT